MMHEAPVSILHSESMFFIVLVVHADLQDAVPANDARLPFPAEHMQPVLERATDIIPHLSPLAYIIVMGSMSMATSVRRCSFWLRRKSCTAVSSQALMSTTKR